MNTIQDPLTTLKKYFKKNKVADINQLKKLLHTSSRMNIFRKLKNLEYCSSFTNAGKYYTLKNIPKFNNFKIWHYRNIGFSLHGNLKLTVYSIISYSETGVTHREIEKVVKIRVYNTLLDLVKEKKVHREKYESSYLYLSSDKIKAKVQRNNRIKQSQQGTRESVLPPWIIIAVLAHIISANEITVDSVKLSSELAKKGLALTIDQIEQIIQQFDIKKKLNKAYTTSSQTD